MFLKGHKWLILCNPWQWVGRQPVDTVQPTPRPRVIAVIDGDQRALRMRVIVTRIEPQRMIDRAACRIQPMNNACRKAVGHKWPRICRVKFDDPFCPIPDVCIDERRLPLFIARATLRELIAGLEARATGGAAQ